MRKVSLIAAALIAGVTLNLNAATIATVNGKNISDTEVSEFFAPMLRGEDFKSLPDHQKKALLQQYIMQDLILQVCYLLRVLILFYKEDLFLNFVF